eukprot:6183936-Pleurochrysis_carterae.AAC.2
MPPYLAPSTLPQAFFPVRYQLVVHGSSPVASVPTTFELLAYYVKMVQGCAQLCSYACELRSSIKRASNIRLHSANHWI